MTSSTQHSLACYLPIPASAITTNSSVSSEAKRDEDHHIVHLFLRKRARQLPRVDKSGVPFFAKQGAVGHQSLNSREYLWDAPALSQYFHEVKE